MLNAGSHKAIKATIWSAFGVWTSRFLALCITVILSRLLLPTDFGIIAMVTVISSFMNIFADAGIGSSIVQFRNLEHKDLQSLVTLSLLLGLILAGILFFFSPYIAIFYEMQSLQSVAHVMSLGFPFGAIGIVPRGMLQRDMRFRAIAFVEIAAALTGGCVGIWLAYSGHGYWALVAQSLLCNLFSSVGLLLSAKISFALRCDFYVIKKIICYSGNLTLFSMINYWARNLDNLLLGRMYGSATLGYYNRAYQLMVLPLTMLTSVVTPVLHTSLSENQDDVSIMYAKYLIVLRNISFISIPVMTFAVIMAPEIVYIVWGDQWGQAVPLFTVLGLNGLIQPIMSTTGTVFLARNKAFLLFYGGILSTALLCGGIILGLPYGSMGVAIGYTLSTAAYFFPLMYFVIVKLLSASFAKFLLTIFPSYVFSLIIVAIFDPIAQLLRLHYNASNVFILSFFSFALLYFLFFIIVSRLKFYKFKIDFVNS
ncbi:MAG: hypothetical protein EOL98_07730 [Negativicutes bacterium]|nr:hypothetical protein [Negativicutes bacterium]